jgi:hypothetical protein
MDSTTTTTTGSSAVGLSLARQRASFGDEHAPTSDAPTSGSHLSTAGSFSL